MGLIHTPQPPPPCVVWTTGAAELQTGHKKKHTCPPQTQLATGDVEARAKLGESRGREALGEDVDKLGGGRDVKDPNVADGDPIMDKV